MEINKVKINYKSRSEKFYLIPIGDVHLGNKGCDIKKFKDMVDWILEKENCFWIGMGDYLDCINLSDKRFDLKEIHEKYLKYLDNLVEVQLSDFLDIIEKIRGKCIGIHSGNHEELIRRNYHIDITERLSKELGAKNLGYSAFTNIFFENHSRRTTYTIFSTHGRVGGLKGGNKINRLEDMMAWFDADVVLLAHSHKKIISTISQLSVRSGNGSMKLVQRKRIGAVTGSFLQGYTEKGLVSYVERWNYPPTDIGVVKIIFIPSEKDLHATI